MEEMVNDIFDSEVVVINVLFVMMGNLVMNKFIVS